MVSDLHGLAEPLAWEDHPRLRGEESNSSWRVLVAQVDEVECEVIVTVDDC